jgi:hypothetical protein
MLCLAELVKALLAELPAHATHLKTAKRTSVVIGQRVVDPEGTGFDFFKESFGLEGIVLKRCLPARRVTGVYKLFTSLSGCSLLDQKR